MFGSYDSEGPGNVYFGAVKPNPIDPEGSLLGLFAVNVGRCFAYVCD